MVRALQVVGQCRAQPRAASNPAQATMSCSFHHRTVRALRPTPAVLGVSGLNGVMGGEVAHKVTCG
jgi:hypothetical protein